VGIIVIGATAFGRSESAISDLVFFCPARVDRRRGGRPRSACRRAAAGCGLVAMGGVVSSLNALHPSESMIQSHQVPLAFLVLLLVIPNLLNPSGRSTSVAGLRCSRVRSNGTAAGLEYGLEPPGSNQDVGWSGRIAGLRGTQ